jgi:glycosyltransferase involved in cell wall biosynthesis
MAPAPGDSKRVAIFTICSNNYMPFARVLFESVRRHHPEAELFLCLADRKMDAAERDGSDWTVIEARDLPIPDFSSFAFRYHILEFNTALKPFMFLHLLDDRGFDAAIYFDPDIQLFAPLTAVLTELHAGASFFFTPHLCSPSEDRREPNDITIMRAGTYNLGFLAVSRNEEATRLLGWWARRLRYQCIDAQAEGLFVDQKFMDLIPCFAPGAIISRDTSLNVAYWNLQQRQLGYTGKGWTVDGAPLTFFHFSGFDPRVPNRLSKHDPRFVGDLPEPLQRLTAHYAECLLARGYGIFPGDPYAYGQFASGTAIHPTIRKMFRDWHPFWGGDPFDGYEAFLHEPWPEASRAIPQHTVTNFMRYLQGAVPQLGSLDLGKPEQLEALVRWFVNDATSELGLDPALVQPAAARLGQLRRPLAVIPPKQDGGETDVTLTASFRADGAASRGARLTFHALLGSGLAVEMRDVTSRAIQDKAPVQIICVAADQIPAALPIWASQSRNDALRILMPVWDLAWFPPAALPLMELVHEVWAPSRFIQAALAGRTDRPVIRMPIAVELDPVASVPRSQLGLPDDRFVFFAPFTVHPTTDREDPCVAIRAFRLAFPQRGKACLALVSRDGDPAAEQRAIVENEIDRDPDILLLDHGLTRKGMRGLMASSDALLSLTRSEGLGLSIAEAMLLNRPVIASRYSASGEFVTRQTGYPVDYRLVPFQDGAQAGQSWADVDLGHAAWIMRRLQDQPQRAAPLVSRARDHVLRNHGRDHVAAMQKARLSELSMQRT